MNPSFLFYWLNNLSQTFNWTLSSLFYFFFLLSNDPYYMKITNLSQWCPHSTGIVQKGSRISTKLTPSNNRLGLPITSLHEKYNSYAYKLAFVLKNILKEQLLSAPLSLGALHSIRFIWWLLHSTIFGMHHDPIPMGEELSL